MTHFTGDDMNKATKLTISDIKQWIDNDESLYLWWLSSKQGKRKFIKENRAELEACILSVLNRPPRR
jgi:hypothetical protein